jgi:RimJ/RimL family protein N-acetyltransferase
MPLPTPTLRTARLMLRPFTPADTDAVFALGSNPHVLRYWDAPPWRERNQAERFIEKSGQLEQDGSGARIGYCYSDTVWGQGYATEAAKAVLRWAFDTLDLNRVQAEADTRNLASARVLEKLGFVLEGTLREDCVVNGDVSDSWVYGLLRREWRLERG